MPCDFIGFAKSQNPIEAVDGEVRVTVTVTVTVRARVRVTVTARVKVRVRTRVRHRAVRLHRVLQEPEPDRSGGRRG